MAGATDMAVVVDMPVVVVDTPVVVVDTLAAAGVDMPAVVAAVDPPVAAAVVADVAAVAAGSWLLPFLLDCPFIPHGMKGQPVSASAIADRPSAESER